MPTAVPLPPIAVKAGGVIGTICSVASLLLSLVDRRPIASGISSPTGTGVLTTIFHLGVLTALAYGLLWTLAERMFGWHYGAGTSAKAVHGWSALALGLSVMLSLAFVPPLYQRFAGVQVLPMMHWRATMLASVSGILAHLAMYGTATTKGIRRRFTPGWEYESFESGLMVEAIYSVLFFGCIVLPYRLVAAPGESLAGLLLGRTLLPALTFFFTMTIFIALKYPDSIRAQSQTRGLVGGIAMMLCFCAGMFL